MTSMDRGTNDQWVASLSLSDLARSLWYYRVSIVGWTLALGLLLGFVIYLMPVKYDSEAQLLVRLGRNTLSTDPTSSITPSVSVQETRLSQVSSVKEMLHSRALAEQIVQRVGADRILQPHGAVEEFIDKMLRQLPSFGGGQAQSKAGQLSAEEAKLHLKEEEALAKLTSSMVITTAKNAYTINVRVRSGSPYLSQDIVRALVELYQDYHVSAYSSGGVLPFFETQTDQAYRAAVATKEKVRRAKNTMGLIEIESARLALREQLTQARRELDQVKTELAATTSEVERYESEMKSLPQRVQAETINGITSNTSDGMRQQLYQLEVQVKELSSKLKDDHPQMRAIRDQLEAASKIAAQERKEQPQSREALNPVFQQLELAYRTSLVRRDGLEAKQASLEKHLSDLDQNIVELNQNELDLTKLNWEATLAENVYLQNAQNRDKAKLIEALDHEGLSEISVVQPATLQLKKSSPKRMILLLAAAVLAGGAGVLQALVRTVVSRERFDDTRDQPELKEIEFARPLIVEPRNELAGEPREHEYKVRAK